MTLHRPRRVASYQVPLVPLLVARGASLPAPSTRGTSSDTTGTLPVPNYVYQDVRSKDYQVPGTRYRGPGTR